jgi:hypothetical protein
MVWSAVLLCMRVTARPALGAWRRSDVENPCNFI